MSNDNTVIKRYTLENTSECTSTVLSLFNNYVNAFKFILNEYQSKSYRRTYTSVGSSNR